MNVAYRAFYAMPKLTNRNKQPIGAVLGLCNIFQRHILDRTDRAIVVWDGPKGSTRRKELAPSYKSNRPPMDEEFACQLPLMRDACNAFGITQISVDHFEADDVIASLSAAATMERDIVGSVTVMTRDKDLVQLLDPTSNIAILDPASGKTLQYEDAKEKYGVRPELLGDVLALAGDASDNIAGVKGVGMKTAATLIAKFGGIDALYENLKDVSGPKRRAQLENSAEIVRLSRELVRLEKDIPVGLLRSNLETPDGKVIGDADDDDRTALMAASTLIDPRDRIEKILTFCDTHHLQDLRSRVIKKWATPN